MSALRVILGEKEFAELVRGKIVSVGTSHGGHVEVALSDIGVDRMYFHIELALREASGAD